MRRHTIEGEPQTKWKVSLFSSFAIFIFFFLLCMTFGICVSSQHCVFLFISSAWTLLFAAMKREMTSISNAEPFQNIIFIWFNSIEVDDFLYTWNQAFVRLSCLIYFLYHLSVIDWDSSLCILIEIKHCYLIQKPEKQSKTLTLWSKERRSKKEWNKTWHGRQTVKAKVTLNMHVRNCLVDRDMSQ